MESEKWRFPQPDSCLHQGRIIYDQGFLVNVLGKYKVGDLQTTSINSKQTNIFSPGGDGFQPLNVKMSQHSCTEHPQSGKIMGLNASARESAAESAELPLDPVLHLMVTYIPIC